MEQSLMVIDRRMSSLEIAEITGKEHKNVLADIKKQFEELEIVSADFSAQYKDTTGRNLPMFNLDEEQTMILASGYNVKLRQKIIQRWMELETAKPKEMSFDEMHNFVLVELSYRISQQKLQAKLEYEGLKDTKNSRLQTVGGKLGGTKKALNGTKKKLSEVYSSLSVPTPDEWEAHQKELKRLEKQNAKLKKEISILED